MKKSKPSKRIVRRSRDSEIDEVPSLLRERFETQRKRARKQDAFNAKLVRASLKQLGLTREALEKRADADFARAKTDSKAHLAKMRRTHAAARKKRGKLRARIEQAFARFA